MASVEALQPAGRAGLVRVARRAGAVITAKASEQRAERAARRDGEHAAPAAQLEHVGADESQVGHQDRSSRRVVMVRKRSSSEVRDGRDALDVDAVVEQPAQQRGDDLAVDRRLRGERRRGCAPSCVGGARDAGHAGQQRSRPRPRRRQTMSIARGPPPTSSCDRALGDDAAVVDDRRDVAGLLDLVEQVRGEQHGAALVDQRRGSGRGTRGCRPGRARSSARRGSAARGRAAGSGRRRAAGACRASRSRPCRRRARPRPTRLERAVDARRAAGGRAPRRATCRFSRPGQVAVEARLLDDRADAGERRGAVAAAGRGRARRMRAGGRLGEAEQQADERRLAGAVGAEEAEGDAARHLEVDRRRARPASPKRLPSPRVSMAGEVEFMGERTRARAAPLRAPG